MAELKYLVGSRVITPHGAGTVKVVEILEGNWSGRYGVLHDVYPVEKPRSLYPENILYYVERELSQEVHDG